MRFQKLFRFAAVLGLVPLFADTPCQADSPRTPGLTFGARLDIPLDEPPASVAFLANDNAAQAVVAVGSRSNPRLRLLEFRQGKEPFRTRFVAIPFPPAHLKRLGAAGPLFMSDEGGERFAVLDRAGQIRAYQSSPGQTNAVAADIDNDGASDLLVFGRGSPGVLLMRGTKEGSLDEGYTLFPEISVSDLAVADITGDGVADLVLIDWLANRLHLITGIGNGVFSERISYPLPGEPGFLSLAPSEGGRLIRIAATFPEMREIRLYLLSPVGDFRTEGVLQCDGVPAGVSLYDLNEDGLDEVITVLPEGMLVFVREDPQRKYTPTLFAVGSAAASWALGDIDHNNRTDAVLINTTGRSVSLLANAEASPEFSWPLIYGVGTAPLGVAVGDFNGDRRKDLVVANSGSSSISLIGNRGKGRFGGQIVVPVPARPARVYSTTGESVQQTYVVSHQASEQVTVVRWEGRSSVSTFTIPTEPNPFIVFAESGRDHKLSFLTRSAAAKGKPLSLSLFEQISDDQFIETTLRPSLPGRISSITASDMDGDGTRDLVFATFGSGSQGPTVHVSKAIDRFTFDSPVPLYTVADSASVITFVKPIQLDDNHVADLLLGLQSGASSLLVLSRSSPDSTDRVLAISGIRPKDEDSVVAEDLNNDGHRDLCILDAMTESVIVLYYTPALGFSTKVIVSPARDVGSIATPSLTASGSRDLVLSNTRGGSVSILLDPFRE